MSCGQKCSTAILSLILLFASATNVSAGPRDHIGGFFLRLSGGGGAANSSFPSSDTAGVPADFELDGASADLNIAIGGMVAKNLALHGTLWGWLLSSPDAKLGDMTGTVSGDVNMNAIGAGLTYYFMPANIYLSGSVGGAALSAEGGGSSGTSDVGVAVDVTIGKEWWVGDKWGIGAAVGGTYHSIPDDGVTWSGTSIAVRFTATMN